MLRLGGVLTGPFCWPPAVAAGAYVGWLMLCALFEDLLQTSVNVAQCRSKQDKVGSLGLREATGALKPETRRANSRPDKACCFSMCSTIMLFLRYCTYLSLFVIAAGALAASDAKADKAGSCTAP